MKKKKWVKQIAIILLIIVCLSYLKLKATYTAYRAEVDASFSLPIAAWDIKIDDENINSEVIKEIGIDDITFSTNHVRENKLAIGSRGAININIDPGTTGVAIKYTLTIIDKSIDENTLLTVSNVNLNSGELIKTGANEYTGVISIADIQNNIKPVITLTAEWIDTGDVVYNPDEVVNTDSYIKINFAASQYNGEEIVEFVEGDPLV